MTTDGAGETMSALQKTAVKQSCGSDTTAERDHYSILRSLGRTKAVFAEESQTGIVFNEEWELETVLTPCPKIQITCITELPVCGEHSIFPRADDPAEAQNDGGTMGDLDLRRTE